MSRKILVAQALGERKLLQMKIADQYEKFKLHGVDILACHKEIMDLLQQLQKINAAITKHNAETKIHTSYGTFLLETAIRYCDKFRSNDVEIFEKVLRDKLLQEFEELTEILPHQNRRVPLYSRGHGRRLAKEIIGSDEGDTAEEFIEAYAKETTKKLVDPLDVRKVAAMLDEKTTKLYEEFVHQIQISNATTFIEIV